MTKCLVCSNELGINELEYCNTCYRYHTEKHDKTTFLRLKRLYQKLGKKPTVLDLFSGCGGLSYGFSKAGYNVVAFVEKWKPAISTFQLNHPTAKHLGGDITKISDEEFAKYTGKIDVIVGGPPCQGFSMCGKRNPKDARNKLYQDFMRAVRIIQPKLILMENVPGLLSMKISNGGGCALVLHSILSDFNDAGYAVRYSTVTASEYGVAQNRKRLVIIGKKLDFPTPSKNRIPVFDAIKDLSEQASDLNGHILYETSEGITEKIKKLKPGEKIDANFNFGRQRLHEDRPSKTITTNNTFIHPVFDRFLTPRECARLQSFPDTFIFTGGRTTMQKQIGNAVPPLLAEAIGKSIRRELQ